jgi:copper chaperone
MKTAIAFAAAACLLATPAARAAEPAAPAAAAATADATVTIPVGGMTCGGCVNNVSGKLKAVEGVKTVAVDLERKQAVVTYDAAKCSPKALAAAITEAGFEPGTPVVN